MAILLVVNNKKEWPFDIAGVEVVEAKAYLTKPEYGQLRNAKLFNLCRSYKYQTTGYYVTLLAAARSHRPLPGLATIQDMRSQTIVRFVSEDLDKLIQQGLSHIHTDAFTLSIYFGRNMAAHYDRLALNLFNLFEAPLCRAQFARADHAHKWELRSVGPIPVSDIPDHHRDFVLQSAAKYFAGKRGAV
ncbi:MAG: RimK-like ATPgrasp N-terminal domain-containing protein, partial [Planctomycetia bacterium]